MTPYIINYSNELVTIPVYDVIPGAVNIKTGALKMPVSGRAARNIGDIVIGSYLISYTGDDTSELRRITGVDRINRQIIIAEPFTIEPSDQVLRVVSVQKDDTICLYNNGAADVYVDTEVLPADGKLLWNGMTGQPPILVYSTSTFQVSNGDIFVPEVLQPIGQTLSRVNDTNVTMTLSGTPATALLEDVEMTLGWTGVLAPSRGGLGIDTSASTGFPSVTAGGWSVLNAAAFRAAIGAGTGSGTVTSVSGTANRVSSTGGTAPVIDIDTAYVGQTSITTLGTITTGTWSATAIALNKIATVTASRALVSDGSGFISASGVSATELGYLSGVTSAIQTQLDGKVGTVGTPVHLTGQSTAIAATTFYTTSADGWYMCTVQAAITTTGGTSVGVQIKFTNQADNVVKTMPSNNNNGVNQCASSSTGNAVCYSIIAYCKTGTYIQYAVNLGGSGQQYSLDATVQKI